MVPARAAFFALALASGAQANPHEFTLPNGLRLIVKEDHRAPTVVHQVWYRAGSMDEAPGTTGVAHVLEHMMFKGTRRFGPGEFSRLVAEAGGRDNAFTSTDFTVYHEQVHRDRLPLAMQLEADRMANLAIPPEDSPRETLGDPPQRGLKRVTVKAPAELPYVRLGYKAPVLRDIAKDWEPFAISLLAELLGGSDAARLHQVLVRERRVASSVGADYEMVSRGPGMVFVEAAAAQGRNGTELEAGVREVIAGIAAGGVTAEELNRARDRQSTRLNS